MCSGFFHLLYLEGCPSSKTIGSGLSQENTSSSSLPLGCSILTGNLALHSELCIVPGCPGKLSRTVELTKEPVTSSQESLQVRKHRFQLNRRDGGQFKAISGVLIPSALASSQIPFPLLYLENPPSVTQTQLSQPELAAPFPVTPALSSLGGSDCTFPGKRSFVHLCVLQILVLLTDNNDDGNTHIICTTCQPSSQVTHVYSLIILHDNPTGQLLLSL